MPPEQGGDTFVPETTTDIVCGRMLLAIRGANWLAEASGLAACDKVRGNGHSVFAHDGENVTLR